MKIYKLTFDTSRGSDHPVFYASLELARNGAYEKLNKSNWETIGYWVEIGGGKQYLNVKAPYGDEQFNIDVIDVVDMSVAGADLIGKKIPTWFSGRPDKLSTILEVKPYTGKFDDFDCVLVLTSNTRGGRTEMTANIQDLRWQLGMDT